MWGGHNDDVTHYADRWLLPGPPEDGGTELAWAQAWCASAPAMLWALRMDHDLAVRAFDRAVQAKDGRAAVAGMSARQATRADRQLASTEPAAPRNQHASLRAEHPHTTTSTSTRTRIAQMRVPPPPRSSSLRRQHVDPAIRPSFCRPPA
jgi:hypothetical protein